MKETKTRLLIALLALVLLPLAACGNSEGDDGDGEDQTADYHYTATSLTLDQTVMAVTDIARVGDTLYVAAYNGVYQDGVYRMDLEAESLELLYDAGELGSLAIAPDGQDGLWLFESTYTELSEDEYETAYNLMRLSADGTVTDLPHVPVEGIYVADVASDGQGNLYICDGGEQILLIDTDGEHVGTVQVTDYVPELATTEDGRVAAYDYGEMAFCIVDWDSQAYGDTYKYEDYPSYLMDGDERYDIYFYDSTALYGYTLETETAETVTTWLDNDMNWISYCGQVDSETLLVDEGEGVMFLLQYTEGSQVDERISLTMATLEVDYMIKEAVAQFNRTNGMYRVEIADYSQYNTGEDESAGLTRLNTEILSGDGPDLIDLTGLPVSQYAASGLLADLGELMDEDGTISRNDYTPSVLEALEVNGGLYSITHAYYVSTVVGRSSQVGADMGWTISDYQALLEQTGNTGFANLTQIEALALLFEATSAQYVDWVEGTCDFTSGAFTALLEMASAYPAEIDESNYVSEIAQLADGTALLTAIGVGDSSDYQLYEAMLGDDITFIGYPTSDGMGGSTIVPTSELGIMSGSDNTEGAWAFLSYLLSAEVQEELIGCFPVMHSALEATLEGFLTPEVYIDEEGNEHEVNSSMAVGDASGDMVVVDITALSEEAVAKFRSLLDSLDTVSRSETSILDIVLEEAVSYFSGSKSDEDVTQLIQNRVSTLMSEQR